MDDVSIYSRALSPTEIQRAMNRDVTQNTSPTISRDSASVTVNEANVAVNHGTINDADQLGTCLIVYASIGHVVQDASNIQSSASHGQPRSWTWTYDTDDGPIESQLVTVYVNDGQGGISSTTFPLVVNNVSPVAVLANGGPVTEGNSGLVSFGNQFDPSVTDTAAGFRYSYDFDNDNSFEVTNGTSSSAIVPASFLDDGPGSRTIRARIEDKDGEYTDYTTIITITNVAPSLSVNNATITVSEGSTATNSGNWSDPGVDVVTLAASVGYVTKNADGTWSWSVGTNGGPDQTQDVTITATDSDGLSSTTTFHLAVNNVAPTAGADTATVAEGGSVIINVLANDSTGSANASGQSLTVTAATALHGFVTINANGTLSYSPAADYNGPDTIRYTIEDNGTTNGVADRLTTIGSVDVRVSEVNDAPTAGADAATVAEDGSVTIVVLGNDSTGPGNESGQSLTITAASALHGSVIINANGTLSYSPAADYNGPDTIRYTIEDNGTTDGVADRLTTIGSVDIRVTEVNDAPIAGADTATVAEDGSVTIAVLGNDATGPGNESGQSLAITAASALHGTVVINANGTLSYSPDADYNGPDTIRYTIEDNGTTDGVADRLTTIGSVDVRVSEVNDVPTAGADAATVAEDGSVTIVVLGNDATGPANESGQSLTIIAASALHGSVTINANGTLSYSPAADYNGPDTISYTIEDDGTTNGAPDPLSATGSVDVQVTEVNDAPIADDDGPYTVAEGGTLNVTAAAGVLNGDTDVDSASLSVILVSGPAHAVSFTLHADGSFSYVHDGSETASDSFSYRTSDGTDLSYVVTVAINITPVPSVTLSASAPSIAEANGVSVVTATLAHTTDVDVLVTISVAGSVGTSDYSLSATQILIPVGQLSGSVQVIALQDTVVEGTETIVISITSATNTEPPAGQAVTVTILDDDTASNPSVSIGSGCSGFALVIHGTESDDTIRVVPQGRNSVKVLIDGQSYGPFGYSTFEEILVYGKAGDDDIELVGNISAPAFLFGEVGHDRLKGGNGPNVLVGGDGDDFLIGSRGDDVLIGGRGADRLVGNQGDDLLISGWTNHDTNLAALCAILDEWSRTDGSYGSRVNNLRFGGGRNGSVRLNNVTVHDDGDFDRLTGSADCDWFFANTGCNVLDQITDRHDTEWVDDID